MCSALQQQSPHNHAVLGTPIKNTLIQTVISISDQFCSLDPFVVSLAAKLNNDNKKDHYQFQFRFQPITNNCLQFVRINVNIMIYNYPQLYFEVRGTDWSGVRL